MSCTASNHETGHAENDQGTFPDSYRITIEREYNRTVGESVTFILIVNGRPRPLANGAIITVECDKKCFEIPVFISKNSRKKFEGVLTGIADGNDIRILWDADLNLKTLGAIKETTNDTVSFQNKPGATRW